MAKLQAPDPVKLVCATLSADPALLSRALAALEDRFGAVDYSSDGYPFDVTKYYESEMGKGLERHLVSFERLVLPDALVEAKIAANAGEEALATAESRRTVNLDVGYLDVHKLVLASGKPGRPKIYLSGGVYADPQAFYAKGSFSYPESAFADFRSGRYERDLLEIRTRYAAARRATSPGDGLPRRASPPYNAS